MKTMEMTSIGASDIDTRDPYALIERIRFLVRHEHDFTQHEEELRDLATARTSGDWQITRKFLRLLDIYHRALDNGGFDVNHFRHQVADFGLHLHAIQEPS